MYFTSEARWIEVWMRGRIPGAHVIYPIDRLGQSCTICIDPGPLRYEVELMHGIFVIEQKLREILATYELDRAYQERQAAAVPVVDPYDGDDDGAKALMQSELDKIKGLFNKYKKNPSAFAQLYMNKPPRPCQSLTSRIT